MLSLVSLSCFFIKEDFSTFFTDILEAKLCTHLSNIFNFDWNITNCSNMKKFSVANNVIVDDF